MARRKIKVAVICGGPSSEREVSLKSGENVFRSLPRKKYAVSKIEITKDMRWLLGRRALTVLGERNGKFRSDLTRFDVVFLALHGAFGEDGTVQAILEAVGVPYTGSGVLASSLGMNKAKTLELVKNFVAIPKTLSLEKPRSSPHLHQALENALGMPYIVKPNESGSSVGTAIVSSKQELRRALRDAAREGPNVLFEEYIKGRELTCGVMGNSGQARVLALPPVEIVTARTFFDYEAKYSPGTQEICPAPIPKRITQKIKEYAIRAHWALGCDGLTRSDFILTPRGKMYFLEINTIPGLTEASLCPKEAKAAGMSLEKFMDRIVRLALLKKR